MWLALSTMTVTGESDKEIKSMDFTPCSFLLLFRKYFFMTASVNGKLENAKVLIDTITTDGSGNAYLGNYVAVFGVSTNTNDTKIEVFKNTLGMFYAHVNNVAGDNYPGTFQFYIWGIKNVS